MLTILYVIFRNKIHKSFKDEDLEFLGTSRESLHAALFSISVLLDCIGIVFLCS